MSNLLRTVQIASLGRGARAAQLQLDKSAPFTIVPRRVVREVGAKILIGSTAILVLSIKGQGRRLLAVVVSDAQARRAGPQAEVLVGQDFLRKELRLGPRFALVDTDIEVQPLSPGEEQRIRAWAIRHLGGKGRRKTP